MAGPWEKYQKAAPAAAGPWTKYQAPAAAPAAPAADEHNPAAGQGFFRNAAAAAGRQAFEGFEGIKQGIADMADPSGLLRSAGIRVRGLNERTPEQVDEQRRMDAPLLAAPGGTTGSIIGAIGTALPTTLIPGAGTTAGATLIGGALGATQPVGTNDSRVKNMAVGAVAGRVGQQAGSALSSAISRRVAQLRADRAVTVEQATQRVGEQQMASALSRGPSGLNPAERAAMEGGERIGMRFTPGQKAGSPGAQKIEAWLQSKAMTSAPFDAAERASKDAIARAAAKAIGETSDTLDSAVIARANDRMAGVFESVRDPRVRTISTDEFVNKLAAVNDEFEGLLPGGSGVDAHPLVKRLFSYAEKGKATGEQLGGLSSKLSRAINKEMTSPSGDRELGQALGSVKEYVDDLVEQGLDGAQKETYRQVRGQWRNLSLLTSRSTIVNPSSGAVNARALASVLQTKDKAGFLRGGNQSDMYTAARAAQAFPPIVGNSGTATRMGPADWIASVPGGAAGWLYMNTPGVANALLAPQYAGNALMAGAPATGNALSQLLQRGGAIAPAATFGASR
jgi:hypothetical protein